MLVYQRVTIALFCEPMVLEYESQHLPEQNHPVTYVNIPYTEHMG